MTQDALLSSLTKAYGWKCCRFVCVLRGGEWNDVWRVQADGKDYVVRWAPPAADEVALEGSHQLMSLASRQVSGVFPPIPNTLGRTVTDLGGRLVAVLPYVHGWKGERGKVNAEAAGAWLGCLHRCAVSLPTKALKDEFAVLTPYVASLQSRGIELEPLRRALESWLDELEGQPTGFIHGDYYPSNVILFDGQIAGVIDWDEATVGPLVWELGRAVWEFAGDAENRTFDGQVAHAFLEGYVRERGPMPSRRLLSMSMVQSRLWDALWDFQGMDRFDEKLEYHMRQIQLMSWIKTLEF
ncbi:MAG: phosphotransferase [Fimbriimonadaceae bacterium]|nr:phosphotransferase [Fimbriimonadaceae bacterium]